MTKTRHPLMAYVAMVEGTDRGVPFRVFFKRIDKAQHTAGSVPGSVLTDLRTGVRTTWVGKTLSWHMA